LCWCVAVAGPTSEERMESASVPSPRAPPGLTTSVEFERRLNMLEGLRFGASVPSFQGRLLELDTLRWQVQRGREEARNFDVCHGVEQCRGSHSWPGVGDLPSVSGGIASMGDNLVIENPVVVVDGPAGEGWLGEGPRESREEMVERGPVCPVFLPGAWVTAMGSTKEGLNGVEDRLEAGAQRRGEGKKGGRKVKEARGSTAKSLTKLVHLNVGTMAGRQHLLDRALMKEGVHIASLVGTRNKKEGRLETASYVWFQGSVAEGRGREEHGGVTIAVNKEWMSKEKVEAREYCVMEGRIGAVRLVGRNLDLTVTAAYAPTEGSLRSTKAEFWDGLKEWLRGTPRRTTPMVLLDANTEMEGRAMNGAKFRDLVGGEWHVMNTRMRKGDEGWTWRQGQRRSKIDFG
jgi:hypothetical protein